MPIRRPEHAFAPEDASRLVKLSDAELDNLPYGAILLDGEGNITRYNLTEAKFAGLDRQRVLGKNFFTQVAPCTNVQEFAGRFREGVARRNLQTVFKYTFLFERGPIEVEITLLLDDSHSGGWVFVTPPAEDRRVA